VARGVLNKWTAIFFGFPPSRYTYMNAGARCNSIIPDTGTTSTSSLWYLVLVPGTRYRRLPVPTRHGWLRTRLIAKPVSFSSDVIGQLTRTTLFWIELCVVRISHYICIPVRTHPTIFTIYRGQTSTRLDIV
jgi:hypothetical protein